MRVLAYSCFCLLFVSSVFAKPRLGGTAFFANAPTSYAEREQAILKQYYLGNIPSFLKNFVKVTIGGAGRSGAIHVCKIYVAPDYFSIGTDDDFVRAPMWPSTAQAIADNSHMVLPTEKLVDLIYQAASVKLSPRPMPAGPEMSSNKYFLKHNRLIESQRQTSEAQLGSLVAGIKKDITVTNLLDSYPKRVAIYGWHIADGEPIQPLVIVHGNKYVDYSHGVRLIREDAECDGNSIKVQDLYRDHELSTLVSKEGPIRNPRAARP